MIRDIPVELSAFLRCNFDNNESLKGWRLLQVSLQEIGTSRKYGKDVMYIIWDIILDEHLGEIDTRLNLAVNACDVYSAIRGNLVPLGISEESIHDITLKILYRHSQLAGDIKQLTYLMRMVGILRRVFVDEAKFLARIIRLYANDQIKLEILTDIINTVKFGAKEKLGVVEDGEMAAVGYRIQADPLNMLPDSLAQLIQGLSH